jgi:diphosphomevalonate decarboxylase
MITARSTPNIALIKYWGNRNEELRLPAADSLSMTLDSPTVEITVDHADQLEVTSFNPDGSPRMLKDHEKERFSTHLELAKEFLKMHGAESAIPSSVSLSIHSHIPSGIGLASSAAVFSALARAYAGLIQEKIELTDAQVSVIARLGSGSASRSIFGGFAVMKNSRGDAIDSSVGEQIVDEKHWRLFDIIIAPSREEKKVGSTEGHALAATSPLFKERLQAIPGRMLEAVDAIIHRDFEKLQRVAEEDALDMHRVMETSTPPLRYLTKDTLRIITEITELRKSAHLPVFFTMDAGPTVHLLCTKEAHDAVSAFAASQKGCEVIEAMIGRGAKCL